MVAVLGCGGGKSVIQAEIARSATDKGNRVLFLVHRRELCQQISNTFARQGVNMELCSVCMVQTVSRHIDDIPKPQIIITDEAHHSTANTYKKIYNRFPVVRLGFTATPCRLNAGGLGEVYDDLITSVSTRWLIENNFLSPYKYYSVKLADTSGLHVRAGDYKADEFIRRCREFSRLLKEYHPNAEMWPSAQQPHSIPDWGERLMDELEKLPDGIDGIITGPNHAFEMDELRRRLPAKYPIRFYPDITHNVRCEYPVHFDRDDWHYALASGLSRECTNPRPCEYREIHRLTRRYVIGSVSYSEGITDDVNKCVWSDMDFFPDTDVRDSLEDYSRLYFPSLPADEVADRILGLELNWQTDPAENPGIDDNLKGWESLAERYPSALKLWRFNQ